jgi:hypothetical protein
VGVYNAGSRPRTAGSDWQPTEWFSLTLFKAIYTPIWWEVKIIGVNSNLPLNCDDPAIAFAWRDRIAGDAQGFPALVNIIHGRQPTGTLALEFCQLVYGLFKDADVLCMHPSAIESAGPEARTFIDDLAKLAIIDEAGAMPQGLALKVMTRGIPYIFGGDDQPLPLRFSRSNQRSQTRKRG